LTHAPPVQLAPVGQAFSQDPQWLTSVLKSTHALPQAVKFASHVNPQTPAVQVAVPFVTVGHAWPQDAQLLGSLCRFTQLLPHCVSPPEQLDAHWPCEHIWPDWQACPQAPQLEADVWRLTQTPPQTPWPAVAHAVPQTPPWHVAEPPLGAGQTWPQAPQLCGSPLTGMQPAPHCLRGAGHTQWGFGLCLAPRLAFGVTHTCPRVQQPPLHDAWPGGQCFFFLAVVPHARSVHAHSGEDRATPPASAAAPLSVSRRESSPPASPRANESSFEPLVGAPAIGGRSY
jgi:hypothetical protein